MVKPIGIAARSQSAGRCHAAGDLFTNTYRSRQPPMPQPSADRVGNPDWFLCAG
jgi:hypothetical protein